jgi:predicted phosphoribosyltransferase
MIFDSRQQAGQLLGKELQRRDMLADVAIGLARGGVVVAAEVAKVLKIPLEVMVVRKIGAPGNPEFAVGAVAEDTVWWDEETVERLGLMEEWKEEQVEVKKKEVEEYRSQIETRDRERTKKYRSIILVDDGAATGISMMAAIKAIRDKGKGISADNTSHRIVIALPVASTEAAEQFKRAADKVVILHVDPYLGAVGQFYRQFGQVEWEEVRELLARDKNS